MALYFELGQSYENLKDWREALFYYEKVCKQDPSFRNVSDHIARISQGGAALSAS